MSVYRELQYMLDYVVLNDGTYTFTTTEYSITYSTGWQFKCNVGVQQGDTLSPSLFALFHQPLNNKLLPLSKGVQKDNKSSFICRWYCSDCPPENDTQDILNLVDYWCIKWELRTNSQKSKLVYFNRAKRRSFNFHILVGETCMKYVVIQIPIGVIFVGNVI